MAEVSVGELGLVGGVEVDHSYFSEDGGVLWGEFGEAGDCLWRFFDARHAG